MPLSMHRLDRVFLAVMVYEGFPAPTDLRAEGGEEPFVGFPVLEKAVLEEEVAAVAESQQVGVMGTQRDFNPLDRFQDEQAEFAVEDVEIEHLVESGPLPEAMLRACARLLKENPVAAQAIVADVGEVAGNPVPIRDEQATGPQQFDLLLDRKWGLGVVHLKPPNK